jgi:hypothetical protein
MPILNKQRYHIFLFQKWKTRSQTNPVWWVGTFGEGGAYKERL